MLLEFGNIVSFLIFYNRQITLLYKVTVLYKFFYISFEVRRQVTVTFFFILIYFRRYNIEKETLFFEAYELHKLLGSIHFTLLLQAFFYKFLLLYPVFFLRVLLDTFIISVL